MLVDTVANSVVIFLATGLILSRVVRCASLSAKSYLDEATSGVTQRRAFSSVWAYWQACLAEAAKRSSALPGHDLQRDTGGGHAS